jgi:hypothetical protein
MERDDPPDREAEVDADGSPSTDRNRHAVGDSEQCDIGHRGGERAGPLRRLALSAPLGVHRVIELDGRVHGGTSDDGRNDDDRADHHNDLDDDNDDHDCDHRADDDTGNADAGRGQSGCEQGAAVLVVIVLEYSNTGGHAVVRHARSAHRARFVER